MTRPGGRNGAGRGGPGGLALLGSIALHAFAIVGFWFAGRSTEPLLPPLKSYRVNIVSPPPLELGPPQPGVAAAEPPPSVEAPKPEPEPPAPKPELVVKPEPPKPEPPKPEAKAPPKPEAKVVPKPETPKTPPRAETRTPPRTEAPKAGASQGGTQSGAPRSTGANPKPGARIGGDGLNIKIDGDPFPFPDYLNNVVIQIARYFRWTGASGLNTEFYFEILPNGSVEAIRKLRPSGNMEFDLAAMGAIELAGKQGAFGPLPTGFTGDRLPISFYFEPPR